MKAAIVNGMGQTPVHGEFAEPVCAEGEVVVTVVAAALSQVTRSRASGRHYSSSGQFPFVAGIDGVGRLDDGTRVYFAMPRPPYGAMAERVAIARGQCAAIPDGLDDATAAAIANPGMSSWAALVERAKLKAGETVLINGATGISGRLAVQIAKYLGAGRVVATGRNPASLAELEALGADVTISLAMEGEQLDRRLMEVFASRVDVVIDYVWGESAERILVACAKAAPEAVPMRFVQVGSTSGADITLPSAVLRSSAIEMMGSGIGSIPLDRLLASAGGVLEASVPGRFRINTRSVALSDVEAAWNEEDASRRTVFVLP